MSARVPPALAAAIAAFPAVRVPHIPFRQRGYLARELADPAWATNHCSSASYAFAEHLLSLGWSDPAVKALPRPDIITVRWRPGRPLHHAVRVGGLVIDWTARQFDPSAPFPLVEPLAAYLARCEPGATGFTGEPIG